MSAIFVRGTIHAPPDAVFAAISDHEHEGSRLTLRPENGATVVEGAGRSS